MELTRDDAIEILRQIDQNRWNWLKLKRFIPEAYPTVEARYAALEQHHADETARMVEVIKALCEILESLEHPR